MKYYENICNCLRVILQDINRKFKSANCWQRTSLNGCSFYRNLYPYELFICGKDYSTALEKFVSVKPGPKRKSEETGGKPSVDVNNNAAENVTSDYGIIVYINGPCCKKTCLRFFLSGLKQSSLHSHRHIPGVFKFLDYSNM